MGASDYLGGENENVSWPEAKELIRSYVQAGAEVEDMPFWMGLIACKSEGQAREFLAEHINELKDESARKGIIEAFLGEIEQESEQEKERLAHRKVAERNWDAAKFCVETFIREVGLAEVALVSAERICGFFNEKNGISLEPTAVRAILKAMKVRERALLERPSR